MVKIETLRLTTFYKLITFGLPQYLINFIPYDRHSYNTRSTGTITTYSCRTDIFKYSFFPFTISDGNNLDLEIWKFKTLLCFGNKLLKIGRLKPNSVYNKLSPTEGA